MTPNSIAARTAQGAGWVMVWRMATRIIGFISTLILARVLVPKDFGLVALAAAVASSVDMLSWIGVQDALVRIHAPSRRLCDTAFTLNALRGGLTAAVIAALAWPIAEFMNEPRLAPMTLALAAGAFLGGLENVGVADFRRDLAFDKEFRLMIVPRLLGAAAAIAGALALRSAWALLIGILVNRVLRLFFSYAMHPFRPRLGLSAWREFLHFSLWTWAGAMMVVIRDRSENFVIGRLLGTVQVGVYSVGLDLALLPTSELLEPLGRALFSGFVASDREGGDSLRAFLRVIGLVALVIVPASVGISALAGPLVRLLLGPTWTGAVPVVQILALSGALKIFSHVSAILLIAAGAPQITARVALCGALTRLGLLLALVPQGQLIGATVAVLLSLAVEEVLLIAAISRWFRVSVSLLLSQAWRSVLASLAMAGILGVTGLGWEGFPASLPSAAGEIAQTAAAGAAVFGGAVLVLWRSVGRPQGAETEILAGARGFLRARRGG